MYSKYSFVLLIYFFFEVMPRAYKRKEETEDGEMKMFDDYSIVAKDEIEWYSSNRGCTHPYGLLFRVLDAGNLDELNNYFKLTSQSPFHQKYEFSLDRQ
jgi:hypothetical protein